MPVIELSDAAKKRADRLQVSQSWISITDEKRYAAAFVVLEKNAVS
jgi:phosphopantetheinyl transferase (holo-ACP synthase)